MEIGILTYYGVHNHGAVLQVNALKMVLEEKGINNILYNIGKKRTLEKFRKTNIPMTR